MNYIWHGPSRETFSRMGNTIDNRFLNIFGDSYQSKKFDKNNLEKLLRFFMEKNRKLLS
jgi:phage tail tube protein FII